MPVTYSVDPSGALVRLRYDGTPTYAEWAEAMRALLAEPAYVPGIGFLVDRRDVAAPDTEFVEGVLEFIRAHRERFTGSRWATVTGHGGAAFGMARMAQVLGESLPITSELFQDISAAEAWLSGKGLGEPVAVTHVERAILTQLAEAGGRQTFRPGGADPVAYGVFDREIVRILQSLRAKNLVTIDEAESRLIGLSGQPGKFAAITAELTGAGQDALR